MAGVYVHIPFCKSRCRYCDFYSTTMLERQSAYISALCHEWETRRQAFGTDIDTLYIGGGTPSAISTDLIAVVRELIIPSPGVANEITMEANPGDLSLEILERLRAAGINRLSIGIQSFNDRLLSLIGRRHTAAEAIEVVHLARKAGFENLSIDLMYGLPTQTMEEWKADIETALTLAPEHISAYCLSYEDGTVLTRMLERGEIEETDEDTENEMFDYLAARLEKAGYLHYEVSNYAKPSYESRHNSSYWNDTPYLGLGAGAHSYDGQRRSWNRGDIDAYIENPSAVHEEEILSETDRYNERVMLSLRTSKGLKIETLSLLNDSPQPQSLGYIQEEVERGNLIIEDGYIRATQQGLHILNRIIENLMI